MRRPVARHAELVNTRVEPASPAVPLAPQAIISPARRNHLASRAMRATTQMRMERQAATLVRRGIIRRATQKPAAQVRALDTTLIRTPSPLARAVLQAGIRVETLQRLALAARLARTRPPRGAAARAASRGITAAARLLLALSLC